MIQMHRFKNLRMQLFLWYVGSLLLLAGYFFIVVHTWQFRYGIAFFIILFLAIALVGFFITIAVTRSLFELSSSIKRISSTNLDARLPTFFYHGEIRELSQSFNDLLDRLHEAFTRERQFIGDVAHELKTPLAIQRGTIEVTLSKERASQEYKNALREVLVDNTTIASTLKNILELAWAQADHTRVYTERINLSKLVAGLKDLGDKLAKQNGITISQKIDPEIYVLGKRDKLERAVSNILDNAIKYSHRRGKISITLGSNVHTAHLSIQDHGVGIAQDDLPHIFERFYRGSKTDKTLGSGLGLAIAHALIAAHHGSISIKSSLNKGTVVVVSLSRAPSS